MIENFNVHAGEKSRERNSLLSFFRAFRYAFDGISHTLAYERNMKVHFAAATGIFLFEFVTRPPLFPVILTILISTAVLGSEMVNTSVEEIVNHITGGEQLPFARIAKDAAAGAVLVLSMGALAVGGYAVGEAMPLRCNLFTTIHVGSAVASASALAVLGILTVRTFFYWRKNQGCDGLSCGKPHN